MLKQPDIRSLISMKLPNVGQIGILVQDITEAVAYYTKLLNIGPWYRSNTIKHEAVFRGKPINPDLDIAIAFQGGVEIELIQVKGNEEIVYSEENTVANVRGAAGWPPNRQNLSTDRIVAETRGQMGTLRIAEGSANSE